MANLQNNAVFHEYLRSRSGLSQNIQEQINDNTAYFANYMLISQALQLIQPKSLMSNYLTTISAASSSLSQSSASSTYQLISNISDYVTNSSLTTKLSSY